MKKILTILVVIVLIGGGVWFFFLRDRDGEQNNAEIHQPLDYPERPGDAEKTASPTEYQSTLSNLTFEYPSNWNVTEGADNTEEAQLLTVESPLDINEFYFCLDINVVGSTDESDFTITDADVRAVDALDSGRHSVIYSMEDLDGLQWGVASEAPQVGATEFTSEITNAEGNRLQVFGRFNCREDKKPDLTVDEFQKARWLQEAKEIINSLVF